MSHKKLTKQQLQENYRNLFEIADELLLEHKDNFFSPDFKPLIEILEEQSGQNFYKRWGKALPVKIIKKSKKIYLTQSSGINPIKFYLHNTSLSQFFF